MASIDSKLIKKPRHVLSQVLAAGGTLSPPPLQRKERLLANSQKATTQIDNFDSFFHSPNYIKLFRQNDPKTDSPFKEFNIESQYKVPEDMIRPRKRLGKDMSSIILENSTQYSPLLDNMVRSRGVTFDMDGELPGNKFLLEPVDKDFRGGWNEYLKFVKSDVVQRDNSSRIRLSKLCRNKSMQILNVQPVQNEMIHSKQLNEKMKKYTGDLQINRSASPVKTEASSSKAEQVAKINDCAMGYLVRKGIAQKKSSVQEFLDSSKQICRQLGNSSPIVQYVHTTVSIPNTRKDEGFSHHARTRTLSLDKERRIQNTSLEDLNDFSPLMKKSMSTIFSPVSKKLSTIPKIPQDKKISVLSPKQVFTFC